MRVGIDIRALNPKSPTGIGKYILSLLRNLPSIDNSVEYDLYYPLLRNFRSWISSNLGENLRSHRGWMPEIFSAERFNRLWLERFLPRRIRRDRIDVFHGPSFLLPHTSRARTAVTIHDLSPVLFPDLYSGIVSEAIIARTRDAVERADIVIADSEATRRDVIDTYSVDPANVRTVYLAVDSDHFRPLQEDVVQEVADRLGLPERFILHVGSYHPRKNTEVLLRAIAVLKGRGLKTSVVLTGKKTRYYAHLQELVCKLHIQDEVRCLEYISDVELRALYARTEMLVYPSLYEGFCIPLVEAMASGVPCIVSNAACLPEIAADAALVMGSMDAEEFADGIEALVKDREKREELRAKGRVRARDFAWENTARVTLGIYRELAGG